MKSLKKIIPIAFVVILFLGSCCSGHYASFFENNSFQMNNVKRFHIVDTIRIEDPVIIEYSGTLFVAPRTLIPNINSNLVLNPDVFLLGENFYFDIEVEDYYDRKKEKIFLHYCGDIDKKPIKRINKKIQVYEFVNKPKSFILCLINVYHRNNKYSCIDCSYYTYKMKYPKYFFFKIVYPYHKCPE